jgi:betaine-aldehyde dehydrogenase
MPTVETAKRLGEAGMFIGGQWRQSSDGATLACVDPATEEQIATIPDASDADVDSAVVAARAALDDWRDRPPGDRATVLFELAGRLQDNEVELAEIDAVDSGNPIRATLNDIRGACREIRMFAGLATEIKGDSVLNGRNQFAYGRREPYGVVGRIIPFNHPLKFAAGKTCAALVAGNTVLLKPSEQTSLSALRLGERTEGL